MLSLPSRRTGLLLRASAALIASRAAYRSQNSLARAWTSFKPRYSHTVSIATTDGSMGGRPEAPGAPSFEIPQSHGNFERTLGPVDVSAAYGLEAGSMRLARWQSKKTGLRVVWADIEGPLVSGYFTVATEIFNDSGVPHTLEHLIFLGSEKYPYKGVLDTLANRAFASGTNAWTDTTHTAYTVTTAGPDGFLRFLPIYVDHLLYATITDAGYTTEVHHINGDGEDAGVVYSEMSARENTADDQMELKTQRLLYPKTSGYRSETGGLMDALRVLTPEQIRTYHRANYVPWNLNLIVTGRVDPVKLLDIIDKQVEPSIIAHKQAHGERPEGWQRPWIETESAKPPKIEKQGVDEIVPFPERDESSGQWQGTWIGPPFSEVMTGQALDLLALYLADSAVSPLYKALVEIEQPFCTDIYFDSSEALTSRLSIYALSVPTEHLSTIRDKIVEVIRKVAEKGIDLSRISMLIEREKLKAMSTLETRAESVIAQTVINDFLFGDPSGKDFVNELGELKRYDELAQWTSQQWAELIKTWYLSAPCLSVVGKPSANLADKLEANTKKRVEERKKKLGEEGLKKLKEAIEAAEKQNNTPIPDEMIQSFPVPSTSSIPFIEVPSARPQGASPPLDRRANDQELAAHLSADTTSCPLFVQFDQIRSHFVTITLHISPQTVPKHLVPLIPLFIHSFFSLPITRDGKQIPYDEVIKQLDSETISHHCGFADTPEDLIISARVHKSNYEIAVRWLYESLNASVFDVPRLRVVTSKLVQGLPAEKREGDDVASNAYWLLTTNEDTSAQVGDNLFKRIESLPALVERLGSEPDAVVKELEELRSHLAQPSLWKIAIKGDIISLPKPVSTLTSGLHVSKSLSLQPWRSISQVLCPKSGKKPSKIARIISMASIESSYGYFAARCPDSFVHPDVPALRVASTVLNNLESFFWREIRGAGLAYGASLSLDFNRGLAALRIYRSPDAAKAFLAARNIVQRLICGQLAIDPLTLEAAKTSLAYSSAASQSTPSDAANVSFLNAAIRGIPRDYSATLLEKCQDVSLEEVLRVMKQYIAPVFDSSTAIAVVSSGPNKVEDIGKRLAELGYTVENLTLDTEADGSEGSESGSESGSDDMRS